MGSTANSNSKRNQPPPNPIEEIEKPPSMRNLVDKTSIPKWNFDILLLKNKVIENLEEDEAEEALQLINNIVNKLRLNNVSEFQRQQLLLQDPFTLKKTETK